MFVLDIPEGDFDAYIFDNDGTLALSMDLHFRAWARAYREHGMPFEFTQELCQGMAGIGMRETVMIMNQRFGLSLDPASVVATQERHVWAGIHTVQPNPPVVEFARKVAATHPVAVASGGLNQTVHKILDTLGIRHLFPVVVTGDQVTNQKPHPEIFLTAAHRLGVRPERCLVFEDSELGIEGAVRAGMKWVRVPASL